MKANKYWPKIRIRCRPDEGKHRRPYLRTDILGQRKRANGGLLAITPSGRLWIRNEGPTNRLTLGQRKANNVVLAGVSYLF